MEKDTCIETISSNIGGISNKVDWKAMAIELDKKETVIKVHLRILSMMVEESWCSESLRKVRNMKVSL